MACTSDFNDVIRRFAFSNAACIISFLILLKAIFSFEVLAVLINLTTSLVVSTVSLVCLASLTAYLALIRIIPL